MTIVSCGHKTSYLAVAILNLPIYDPKKVNLVILPMDFDGLPMPYENTIYGDHKIDTKWPWMQPYFRGLKAARTNIRSRVVLMQELKKNFENISGI